MTKKKIKIIVGIVLFTIIAFLTYNYIKMSSWIGSNPTITKLTERDIKVLEKELSVNFPECTQFISLRHFSTWQDSSIILVFDIPMTEINRFRSEIKGAYEKESFQGSNEKEYEVCYECNNRQFTEIYEFPEQDDMKRFEWYYWRSSDEIHDIFERAYKSGAR